jgi:PilZ domain-containing protein
MSDVTAARRSNRRLTARRACHLGVQYRTNQGWRPATAMDLSNRGCRLRVGEDLARGASVSVMFETPDRPGAKPLESELVGIVIWSRREGLSYQVGLQFEDSPDALNDILNALS